MQYAHVMYVTVDDSGGRWANNHQLLDSASDFRTHAIRQARKEVESAYSLKYPERRVTSIECLLSDFAFLSENPCKVSMQAG